MARPEYHRFYARRAWQRKAKAQLRREPLCRHCLERGRITPAEHADHIEPHQGDADKFWRGAIQSLCAECHSRKTAREQGKRVRPEVGADGAPEGW